MNKIVKIDLLVPDPNNPRQEFNLREMAVLKSSISTKGILQPITVEKWNNKYLIIDGERRYRTAKALGWKEVPVTILEPMSELERFSTRYHIQEQHSGWSAFDKAKAISLFKTATGLNTTEIAEMLGMQKTMVSEYISLLSLSKRSMSISNERKLTLKVIIALSRLKKSIEDVPLSIKLENAVVDRIESGMIVNSEQITRFTSCINFLEENPAKQLKLVNKIISNPDYSPNQASKESEQGDYVSQKKVLNYCRMVTGYTKIAAKAAYTLTDKELEKIDKCIASLEKYKDGSK